jgi:hypothetical protein
MTNTPNPHYISQNATGSSLTQPVDTVDFPHSGLIKALNQMAAGNVVVKTGTDFDINQTGGNFVISAGKILRNGKYHEVSSDGNGADTTIADSSLTTTYAKGYHLLVVADGREVGETADRLYLRPPTANERVPEFKLGDTIVAMIEYSSSTSAGSRLIQYFTTNKESNSLSIAYANSNVYTQAMTVDADADGDVTFENVVQDKDIIFKVNDSDGGGSTEVARIDGENARVGIGTNSPDTKLHIAGDDLKIVSATNAKPLLTLENTTATSSAATPPTILFKRSGTPAQSGDLGMLQFIGKDSDDDSEHEYVRIFVDMQDETETTEDGRLIINIGRGSHQANSVSNTEMLRMSGGEGIIFNYPKHNVDFEIRGDTNDNLFFADAGNERVGILNGSPDATLDIVTGGTFRNTRLLTVSVSASTTLTEAAHAGRYNICAGNITLPSTSTAGEHYAILNTTGGDITIGRNGNNINGAGSDATLGTFKAATCIAIGSNNWMVIGV